MTIEEKKLLKTSIIDACKLQQQNTIANLKREMDEHQQQANDYGPPKDRYDAFRSQMLRRRDIFAEQLQKANEELYTITKINPAELKTDVGFGAIVITDKQKLFVAISTGKVQIGEDVFYCISTAVPIYKAIDRLKPGDKTVFNGNSFSIVDVF
jgi:hypothetical protein